jgi:hypothetical protein
MHSQITRIRNKDGSESLKRHSDGLTLPYSGLPYHNVNRL